MTDIEELLTNGSDRDKAEFIIENVLAMCEATDLCAHCIAEAILDIVDKNEGKEIIH